MMYCRLDQQLQLIKLKKPIDNWLENYIQINIQMKFKNTQNYLIKSLKHINVLQIHVKYLIAKSMVIQMVLLDFLLELLCLNLQYLKKIKFIF